MQVSKVNVLMGLLQRYPGGVIPGDAANGRHDLLIGEYSLEGVGQRVEVVEVTSDDTYVDDPFEPVYEALGEIGLELDRDKVLLGYSSSGGRFMLLPQYSESVVSR